MMKRFIFSLLTLFVSVVVLAQDATKILDKTAATLKAAGNVKIGFVLSVENSSSVGYIKLKGEKFVVNMDGFIIWFDGTTMWNYVKSNKEVNVSTPSASEVSRINPYSFLTFYKNGYNVSSGKGNSKEHEIVLEGNGATLYKNIVVRINKSSNLPVSIRMVSARGGQTTAIQCTSYLKKQKYSDTTFRFNPKKFPNVEVIDLR